MPSTLEPFLKAARNCRLYLIYWSTQYRQYNSGKAVLEVR